MKLNKPHLKHLVETKVIVPEIDEEKAERGEAFTMECYIELTPTPALQSWLDENGVTEFEMGFDCNDNAPKIEFTHRSDYENFAASFPTPSSETTPA